MFHMWHITHALHACIRIAFKEIHEFASHALFSITRFFIGWHGLSPSPTVGNCVTRVGGPLRTVYPGLRWGTNELGDQWEHGRKGYTNEMGDQWDLRTRVYTPGPMRTAYPGLHWGTNEIGDQWELCTQGYTGGPMRWGTNENCVPRVTLGDQWGKG